MGTGVVVEQNLFVGAAALCLAYGAFLAQAHPMSVATTVEEYLIVGRVGLHVEESGFEFEFRPEFF